MLTDADKFGKRLTYGVARLRAGMQVVTDARLAPGWQARLAELGVGLDMVDAG